jgi:hypothetical protein
MGRSKGTAGVLLVFMGMHIPSVGAAQVATTATAQSPERVVTRVPLGPPIGLVIGVVREANGEPIAQALVQLRDVRLNAAGAVTRTTGLGEFTFAQVVPGRYIAELVEDAGGVRAVSGVVVVQPYNMTRTEIVVATLRVPLAAALWRNSALAALAAAAASGVMGVAATGLTASPER